MSGLWEAVTALWSRSRWRRLQKEAASRLLEAASRAPIADDHDAVSWQLVEPTPKDSPGDDRGTLRDKARRMADTHPHARQALSLYRHYVVGVGMRHEVQPRSGTAAVTPERLAEIQQLWEEFRRVNAWDVGLRKDWEFCHRTWRDGECFLRLFPQADWPPRIHFVDPELIAPDPVTGQPSGGIVTEAENVELPVAYHLVHADGRREWVPADEILHTKIGVDSNVKRGVSLLWPVLESLKQYQAWLEVELLQRKVAASVVLVRKHRQQTPTSLAAFADAAATATPSIPSESGSSRRRLTLQPGSIIDAQGFDLELLAPNTHFSDASLLGRALLLAVAAGLGLPDYMLTSDASNGNYASTLVAETPAVRHFAAWQAFFIGQWQLLFDRVLVEAERLGLLLPGERQAVVLHLTPPPLTGRNRWEEAQADAVYYDRGALSARELARRNHVDPEAMRRERQQERREDEP
jgi:capsid protein